MDASIIIPTKSDITRLGPCLDSLLKHYCKRHFTEVIVVDTSSHGFISALDWHYEVKILRKAGATFAEAVNHGAANSTGLVIVPLNDDTITADCWLEHLLTPTIGGQIVGALLLYPAGEGQAATIQHAGVGFDVAGNPYHLWKGAPAGYPPANEPRIVPAVTFACAAVSRFLWRELGGLDEGFKNGYEDIDFCLRARELGYVVAFEPKAILTHLEAQSPGRFEHEGENKQRFNERWVESGRIYQNLGQWPFQPGG